MSQTSSCLVNANTSMDEQGTGNMMWVANRNNQIPENSGVLILDEAENLRITYSGGSQIVIYSSVTRP